MPFTNFFEELLRNPVSTLLEIGLLASVIYGILRFLRSTRGFGVLRGLVIVFATAALFFFGLRVWPGVPVIEEIVSRIGGWVVLVLFVLFQPELRQGISRFGRAGWFRFFSREVQSQEAISRIVAASQRMAKERIGALIAFERASSLGPYRDNAVQVNAPVSGILLETIFYPGSPLHDGAVVIRSDEILAAACLFPLSESHESFGRLGTRHRAAVGITEETDAVTLVVSEETGSISLSSGGELFRQVPFDQLEDRLLTLLRTESKKKEKTEKEEEATAEAKPEQDKDKQTEAEVGSAEPEVAQG